MGTDYTLDFMSQLADAITALDASVIDRFADDLADIRSREGRVFVAGLGGSAANASHAVCDLRNLAGIEAVSLTDNTAAFSAAANDHGWDESLAHVLRCLKPRPFDGLMVMSVGGGCVEPPVSVPLVRVLEAAKAMGMKTFAVVGPRGGVAAELADIAVRVPVAESHFVTVHTEVVQGAVWHCLVTHPRLATTAPMWERLSK